MKDEEEPELFKTLITKPEMSFDDNILTLTAISVTLPTEGKPYSLKFANKTTGGEFSLTSTCIILP